MSLLFKVDVETKEAKRVKEADFSQLGLKERGDIQQWVRDNPRILEESLLIIAEEFADFDRTNERLDLLAVDRAGNLVVIELKRDDSGTNVHGQAIKYASYLDRATAEEIVRLLASYQEVTDEEAGAKLRSHIGSEDLGALNAQQRIILASHRFAPEVTSAVLWLNERFGRPLITCVELTPHVDPATEALYLQSSTIIPVPGTRQYRIRTGVRGDSGVTEQPSRANPHLREIRTALDLVQGLLRDQLADGLFPERAYRPTQWGYWLYWYDRKPWGKWDLCYMIQLVNIESVQRERWWMLLAGDDAVSADPTANWAAEVALIWKETEDSASEALHRCLRRLKAHPDQIRLQQDEWCKLVVRLHAQDLDEEFVGRFADELQRFIEKTTRAVDEACEGSH